MRVYRVAALVALVILGTVGVARAADPPSPDHRCPNVDTPRHTQYVTGQVALAEPSPETLQDYLTAINRTVAAYVACAGQWQSTDKLNAGYADLQAANAMFLAVKIDQIASLPFRNDLESAWELATEALSFIPPGNALYDEASLKLHEIEHAQANSE